MRTRTEDAINYMGEMDSFIEGNARYNVFGECSIEDRRDRIVRSINKFFPCSVSRLENFFSFAFHCSRSYEAAGEKLIELEKGLGVQMDDKDMFSGGSEADDWLEVAEGRGGFLNRIKSMVLSVYHAFAYGSQRPVRRRVIAGLDKKIDFLDMLEKKAKTYLEFNQRYIPFCEETMETLRTEEGIDDRRYGIDDMSLKVRGLKRDVDSLQDLLYTIDMDRKACVDRKNRIEKL